MLCVSLPLEAAVALCLSGYLYLNGRNAMDGWWMTVCSLPSPSLSPITETFKVPRRCPKAAQTSWVQIRRVRGDSAVSSFSHDNAGQCAAHRGMLCFAEWKAFRPPFCTLGSVEATEAAVSWCIRGDGALSLSALFYSSVNFNTSMHRRRRSLGEERQVQRKEMLWETKAFVWEKNSQCSYSTLMYLHFHDVTYL